MYSLYSIINTDWGHAYIPWICISIYYNHLSPLLFLSNQLDRRFSRNPFHADSRVSLVSTRLGISIKVSRGALGE